MTILESYAAGLSARQTAKLHDCEAKKVRTLARQAGILRTKSEGMYLRYNPSKLPHPNPNDALVLKLSFATIRSPYTPVSYFMGVK